jgi:integrase
MALQKWLTASVKGWETQKKTKELLFALLDAAIKDGERISTNPAAHLTMTATKPVKHPDDLKPPTAAQYDLIHAALPPYYQRIFRDFAYETAMRPGEVAGARLSLPQRGGAPAVREGDPRQRQRAAASAGHAEDRGRVPRGAADADGDGRRCSG